EVALAVRGAPARAVAADRRARPVVEDVGDAERVERGPDAAGEGLAGGALGAANAALGDHDAQAARVQRQRGGDAGGTGTDDEDVQRWRPHGTDLPLVIIPVIAPPFPEVRSVRHAVRRFYEKVFRTARALSSR